MNNQWFSKIAVWLVIALVLFTVFKQFDKELKALSEEHSEDLADDNGVVAAVVAGGDFALHLTQRAVDERSAVSAGAPIQVGEFIDPLGGEAARDIFLILAQKIHVKAVSRFEAGVAGRSLIDADDHQRRIER